MRRPAPTTPSGPEWALKEAVEILGPYPWECPERREPGFGFESLPAHVTPEAVKTACANMARRYRQALNKDETSPRLGEAIQSLRSISHKTRELARMLSELTDTERRLLHGFSPNPKEPSSRLGELYREIYSELPPFWGPMVEGVPANGALADLLHRVSEYAMLTASSLENPSGNRKPDRGGKTNAFRLIAAPPAWKLIDMSWRLLENAPHRAPTGTVNGALHKFVLAMHEWTTGEDASGSARFEYHLKKYATAKRDALKLSCRLEAFLTDGPGFQKQDVETALFRPWLTAPSNVPEYIVHEGRELARQYARANFKLIYGPAHVASK